MAKKKPAKKVAKKFAKKVAKKSARKSTKKSSKKVSKPLVIDSSVPPVSERLNRDEKNQLRKQLQVDLKAEKDPAKRTQLRKSAALLLKY